MCPVSLQQSSDPVPAMTVKNKLFKYIAFLLHCDHPGQRKVVGDLFTMICQYADGVNLLLNQKRFQSGHFPALLRRLWRQLGHKGCTAATAIRTKRRGGYWVILTHQWKQWGLSKANNPPRLGSQTQAVCPAACSPSSTLQWQLRPSQGPALLFSDKSKSRFPADGNHVYSKRKHVVYFPFRL